MYRISIKTIRAIKKMKNYFIHILIILLLFDLTLVAQENEKSDSINGSIKIFFECNECDKNYMAENLDIGQMTTEDNSSDVHVILNESSQGGGALVSSYIIIGHNRFKAIRDTIEFNISSELSPDEKRELEVDKLRLGLVPFVMKTPDASRLFLFLSEKEISQSISRDPWRNWVFYLSGMGSVYSQQNHYVRNLTMSLNINKITDKIKIESYTYYNYNESKYTLFDIDSNKFEFDTYLRNYSSHNLIVKSIKDHWGIGVMFHFMNDRPNNLDFQTRLGPAIEYNIFSYKDALHKQLRFLYSILYEKTNYVEYSIYDRLNHSGIRQNLSIMARFNQAWGFLDASVTGSNYMDDISLYSVGGNIMTNIRIPKVNGLSFNISCGLNMFRDRIHEAKGFASQEDIYSRRRAISSDYQFSISAGISIRIGSKQFTRANPRFSH